MLATDQGQQSTDIACTFRGHPVLLYRHAAAAETTELPIRVSERLMYQKNCCNAMIQKVRLLDSSPAVKQFFMTTEQHTPTIYKP